MKLLIVDLLNLAFRTYWGYKKHGALEYEGKPTFMCYGAALALNKLLWDYQPSHLIIASDGGGKTFRHDLYAGYKSNRNEAPDDFKAQMPELLEMIAAYGFQMIKFPGVEADDVIGTLARRFAGPELPVYIVSGDKDFMQLVNDHTFLVRPTSTGFETFNKEIVSSKFGVKPDQVIDALAIIGDASDTVPGVHGIGEKGAANLIRAFGSLENIYSNISTIKPNLADKLAKSRDMAFLSKKLVTIDTEIPILITLSDCAVPVDVTLRPQVFEFYQRLGFKSLTGEIPSEW